MTHTSSSPTSSFSNKTISSVTITRAPKRDASTFLQHYQLHLTPLSPIHLGTGEDYEPTNYVINDELNLLHEIEPSRLNLTERDYRTLLGIAKNGDLLGIQNFFNRNRKVFLSATERIVSVTPAITQEYSTNIGKVAQKESNNNSVFNQFSIERSAWNQYSGENYIPGSSFKGALRTALLTALNHEKKITNVRARDSRKYEEQVLEGSFTSDPLRMVKPSDLMPTKSIYNEVGYVRNFYKRKTDNTSNNIPIRQEIIVSGQYRAFRGDCNIQQFTKAHLNRFNKEFEKKHNCSLPLPKEKYFQQDLATLAQKMNQYALANFNQEVELLEALNLIDNRWLKATRELFKKLKDAINQGRVMLVRLGKNTGAESKTDPAVASIKIMQGPGKTPKYQKKATTIWLYAEQRRQQNNLLPFGWALVEINPKEDNQALQTWCNAFKSHLNRLKESQTAWEKERDILTKKAKKAEEAAKKEAQKEAKEQAQIEKEAEEKAAYFAALPKDEQLIVTIKTTLEAFEFNVNNHEGNTEQFTWLTHTLKEGLALEPKSQAKIAEALPFRTLKTLAKGLITKRREKEVKAILSQLRGE